MRSPVARTASVADDPNEHRLDRNFAAQRVALGPALLTALEWSVCGKDRGLDNARYSVSCRQTQREPCSSGGLK